MGNTFSSNQKIADRIQEVKADIESLKQQITDKEKLLKQLGHDSDVYVTDLGRRYSQPSTGK